jgi:hypothetical protein
VIDGVTKAAQVPIHRLHVLATLMAAIAAMAPVCAQDRTPEQRLVQAFVKYCVGTSADPALLRDQIEKGAPLKPYGETRFANRAFIDQVEILDPAARSDPHQRMLIYLGQGLGDSGRKRSCQVSMPWGDKAKLIAEVAGYLKVADGSSTVIQEGQSNTDLTRWTTRIGDNEAVVELGMPTFTGAPGRALTLSLEGRQEE